MTVTTRVPPPGGVDLWMFRPPAEAPPGGLTSGLDPAERERAESFAAPADRLLYASAHRGLRRILAGYTGGEPAGLRFVREDCPCCGAPHGRPALAGSDVPYFSLSHTRGLILVGVADVPVGVDVEAVPSPTSAEILLPSLHPAESAELSGLPPAEFPAVFARLWTRKEAYLKAIGTGLGRDLAEDYLGDRTGDQTGRTPRRPDGWTVVDLPCPPAYAAAAAVRGALPAGFEVHGC